MVNAKTLTPPFRAEHVGSLHRPQALKEARGKILGGLNRVFGRHNNQELTRLEDDFIRDIVRLQEELGLKTITDGEYRRQVWLSEFLSSLQGLTMSLQIVPGAATGFRSDERLGKSKTEDVENVRVGFEVKEKIRWIGSANVDAFQFLSSIVGPQSIPKVTIPAPQEYYFFKAGPDAIRGVYKDADLFWADMAAAYKQELGALIAAGCRHIQLDDVVYACVCDPKHSARLAAEGDDPMRLVKASVDTINNALADCPNEVTISLHICRGNRHGHFMAEGGYDVVAQYLFTNLHVDNYYLEYDSPRAGSFEPLRFIPSDKSVVLGLVTTKRPQLEAVDLLCRRIDDASRFMPLERLAVSPQCGFSGDMMSDVMSIEQMRDKLRLVCDVATKVWGET
jgi:5-methyltetrahydropteroyltriglutamate--homocysteine methyltransferase